MGVDKQSILPESESDLDPVEQVETGVSRNNEFVAGELLTRLHENEPVFFEQGVLDLLMAMGYCQMRVFGTGVLGTRYCRVPGSWYRAEGCVGPDR